MPVSFKELVEDAEASACVGTPSDSTHAVTGCAAKIAVTPAITVADDLPQLPPEVIGGIIRRGGKLLVSGASKSGKSYLLIELAVAVATGGRWVGMGCSRGRVLYANLEIQEPQFMHRVFRVCEKTGADAAEVTANLSIANLRGQVSSIDVLVDGLLESFGPGDYDLVIVDPAYKVQSGCENDATPSRPFAASSTAWPRGCAAPLPTRTITARAPRAARTPRTAHRDRACLPATLTHLST